MPPPVIAGASTVVRPEQAGALRRDDRGDAAGLGDGEVEVRPGDGVGAAQHLRELVGPAREPHPAVDRLGDGGIGGLGLEALGGGDLLGELRAAALRDLGHAVQHLAAVVRGLAAPSPRGHRGRRRPRRGRPCARPARRAPAASRRQRARRRTAPTPTAGTARRRRACRSCAPRGARRTSLTAPSLAHRAHYRWQASSRMSIEDWEADPERPRGRLWAAGRRRGRGVAAGRRGAGEHAAAAARRARDPDADRPPDAPDRRPAVQRDGSDAGAHVPRGPARRGPDRPRQLPAGAARRPAACPGSIGVAAYGQPGAGGRFYLPNHPAQPAADVAPTECWPTAEQALDAGYLAAPLPDGVEQIGRSTSCPRPRSWPRPARTPPTQLGFAVPCPGLLPHVPRVQPVRQPLAEVEGCVMDVDDQRAFVLMVGGRPPTRWPRR